jgi:hypothetical protein
MHGSKQVMVPHRGKLHPNGARTSRLLFPFRRGGSGYVTGTVPGAKMISTVNSAIDSQRRGTAAVESFCHRDERNEEGAWQIHPARAVPALQYM